MLLRLTVACFLHLCACRANERSVSDGSEVRGMEKNIADQLNKAFDAYRTASIERDNAKKELQQKVAHREIVV